MNKEIIIIQNKLDLVMKAVSKIIEINYKFSPIVFTSAELRDIEFDHPPKLLIIDQTVFSSELRIEISELLMKIKNTKIIIVTLDHDERLADFATDSNDVEVINLWKRHTSIIEYLISIIGRKIKTIRVI